MKSSSHKSNNPSSSKSCWYAGSEEHKPQLSTDPLSTTVSEWLSKKLNQVVPSGVSAGNEYAPLVTITLKLDVSWSIISLQVKAQDKLLRRSFGSGGFVQVNVAMLYQIPIQLIVSFCIASVIDCHGFEPSGLYVHKKF